MSGCSECGGQIYVRGLCKKHYENGRRTGAVARVNARREGECGAAGCGRQIFARGMCATHYYATDHPLKTTWRNLRSRSQGDHPAEWERFDAFLRTRRGRIIPLDRRPPGPRNPQWKPFAFLPLDKSKLPAFGS